MQALDGPSTGQPQVPALQPGQAIDFAHLSPETAITLRSAGRDYSLSARDVIRWVAPGAPLSEAVRLLVVSQNVNLNPMLKEIELLEIKGSWHIYVRKQGLIKIALRYPEYDGHETGLIVQDIDETRPAFDVIGCYCPAGYKIVGGWAKVYRKGVSRPIVKRVNVEDYAKSKGIWQDNPAVMIEKVALAQALRESFPIGEIYDEAELPGVQRAAEVAEPSMSGPVPANPAPSLGQRQPPAKAIEATPTPVAIEPEYTPPSEGATSAPAVPVIPGFDVVAIDVEALESHEQPCTASQQVEFNDISARLGLTAKQLAGILSKRGVESIDQLTVGQLTEINLKLSEKLSAKEFDFLADKAIDTPTAVATETK